MAKEVQWDRPVHREKEVYLACQVCLDLRDIVVSLVSMAPKAALGLLVKREKKDLQDHLDPMVLWDLLDPVVNVEEKVLLVRQV